MPALSEYTNVYNSALAVLRRKGYQLWYDSETECFCCEKDGWDFMADSPCGLLGLVAMFEAKCPDRYVESWWREENSEDFRNLPAAPLRPYTAVWKTEKERLRD
jgi:hypothetical protein